VAAVESLTGRRLVFMSIQDGRGPDSGSLIEGFHANMGEREQIWLDPALPASAQEAIAAHELAHVLQEQAGYPRPQAIATARGKALPALAAIAARTKDLVLDQAADDWAREHGFGLKRAFQAVHLPLLVARLEPLSPQPEAHAWTPYSARLRALSRMLRQGETRLPSLGDEPATQVRALDYASLSLRLGRFGLFDGLDVLWARLWPASRNLGGKLAATVLCYGVGDAASCRRSMKAVLRRLGIPARLIRVL
jgi:hypothetical protein